jgi:hypothetical protein
MRNALTTPEAPRRPAPARPATRPWEWNRRVGWASACLGVLTGAVMGLWSFDGPLPPPAWLGEYGDTARRLARLGHIAFFGLGILDLLLARELPRSALGPLARRLASGAMIFGNVFLPLTLFAAAAYHPLKYLMGAPVFAVFLALVLAAYGAWGGAAPGGQGDPNHVEPS